MKKSTTILLLIISAVTYAQSSKTTKSQVASLYDIPGFEIDSETQMVLYTDVVKVEGASKDSLYVYGQRWIKKQFKSVTSIMKVQDPAKGILEGRHSFYVNKDVDGIQTKGDMINYTFTLTFKDGRYKYSITRINVQKASYYGIENWLNDDEKLGDEQVESYLQQIDEYMQNFIVSLTDSIKPTPPKKEDEW
ncbi:MAG: DUF4468 domain-containing protein [Chitinophagales bacterium]|nr:DUF4468 domain-containing protein [Chitinophagales bacterium]